MTGDVIVIDMATSVHVGLSVLPTTSDCQSDGYLQSRTYITYVITEKNLWSKFLAAFSPRCFRLMLHPGDSL